MDSPEKDFESHRIFLIRHGKPEFPYTNEPRKWISGREFNRLIGLYDQSALNPEWNKSRLDEHAGKLLAAIRSSQPLCSDLLRARQTAELFLPQGANLQFSALFREVPLPTVPPFLSLPAYWHLLLARMLWYAGKKTDEPKKAAFDRVRKAADMLESHGRRGTVSLFSHGFFLYILTRELMDRGWHSEETRPMRYLEIRCLRPGTPESRKSS